MFVPRIRTLVRQEANIVMTKVLESSQKNLNYEMEGQAMDTVNTVQKHV